MAASESLTKLVADIRACHLCDDLPHGPRPIVQLDARAPILIIGQAPGRRVHESGIPWDDPSGQRLREWLQMDQEAFYNPQRLGLMPMGFCYPGTGKSGDLPPRAICAETWHERVLAQLQPKLILLIGQYAQRRYLPDAKKTLTDTVKQAENYLPYFPLPHPSPRNQRWLKNNPWFEAETIPLLRAQLSSVNA